MAQLSRPYQVALGAIGLLAAVWFIALRGHSGASGGAGATPTPSAHTPQPVQPATPSSPYHGSAPGVAGLTRAIEKARGAVAQSEANAKQLQEKSAQASSPSSSGTHATGTLPSTHASRSAAPQRRSVAPHSPVRTHTTRAGGKSSGRAGVPARQTLVEGELKQGSTVLVLFWDRKGADDVAVRHELQALQAFHRVFGLPQSRRIVVHEASAREVGSFGSFTRAAQVYSTPTILIILPSGKTSTLTGLTDAYSIQQAISEARRS